MTGHNINGTFQQKRDCVQSSAVFVVTAGGLEGWPSDGEMAAGPARVPVLCASPVFCGPARPHQFNDRVSQSVRPLGAGGSNK